MAKETEKSTTSQQSQGYPTEDAIRIRAFELYEQRGGEAGHDVEDWLKAEQEITAKAA